MKKLNFIYWVFILITLSCFYCSYRNNKDISDKFESFKEKDFSKFNNMHIVNRKGIYFITYHNLKYKISKNYFIEKMSCIEKCYANNEVIALLESKDTINILKNTIRYFEELEVLLLSVDDKGNVFISIRWYDRCTYNFLKLSSECTLKDLNKLYYLHYEDNWYLDKVCAEK